MAQSSDLTRSNKSLKSNLYILYAISLLQGMVFYGPIATLYRQAVGVGVAQIALIESISLALCILLELPWGMVADKIGYKNTMLVCCGLYFVSKIVFWKAQGFGMFLTERIMLSVVYAGLSGVDTSILYLSSEKEKAQSAFGIYNTLATVGLMAAAGVYSLFIGENYRLAGFLTVISYGVAALLALGIKEVRPAGERQATTLRDFLSVMRDQLRNKYLLLFLLAAALLNETHQIVTVFLNQLQYVGCGMSDTTIGWVYILVTVAGLCGGMSARFTRRLGDRRLGWMLFGLCAGACLTLAATHSALLSVGAMLILRIGFSLFQPLQSAVQNRQVTSLNRATALSVHAIGMEGVSSATYLVYGAVSDRSLPLAMLMGGVFCIIGLVLYTISMHGFRKKAAEC